jgi:gliding motility-associated-like protein
MKNLLLAIIILPFIGFSQAIIQVKVLSVQTLANVDCDGLFLGNSDFVWEFTGTDNTLGLTNNNPALFGIFGFNYGYKNNDNGAYTMTTPGGTFSPNSGLFFNHNYLCVNDVPTSINLAWEAYENDDAGNYDVLGLTDGQTGLQNVTMPVPAAVGILNYSFTAASQDGGCAQVYAINLQVERLPLVVNYMQDNICAAQQLTLNTTYTYGFCNATLEPNEPAAQDVQNAGSLWAKFVAPASGSVNITSDLAGTDIGTYFQIYHAADGMNCTDGVNVVTGQTVKNKFEYLSHIDFSDGIDLLGIDPEAEIVFDACDPIPFISYQKLIPGQTYYIQFTADGPNEHGYYQLRVDGLGGGAPNLEDIPCLSNTVNYGTNVISSANNSTPTANLSFGCALDGGNTAGETGQQHTSSNPTEYHAYDYPHIGLGNPSMNESVWLNFIAPNSGRITFEGDYQSALYGESAALFGYDKAFGPGVPNDFLCSNLTYIASDEGGTNSFLGGDPSAIVNGTCLEPGYRYFGMIDPSDAITPLSAQNINSWVFNPSISDPSNNAPGNDILCLTLLDTLYEVPVIPAGTNPTFQAVAGSNVLACREYLAGEPPLHPNQANRADQTVWHYFVGPPSGAVELSIRAYIGMNLLRFNVFELLNGTNCYGGLGPATYTVDGTRYTPSITPLLSGTANYNGHQETLCCLDSGKVYAIQIDGGSPGDEGQYIIEYIKELTSDAGDIFANSSNGGYSDVNLGDTLYVCYGDTVTPGILLNGIGQSTASFPACISGGYVIHQTNPVPDPVMNSGFTYIDSIQGTGVFVNNGNGNGSFGNLQFNTLYYLSPAADQPASWGTFNCRTATVEHGIPVVYLQSLTANFSYNNNTCTVTFSATGGMNAFSGMPYNYTITNPLGVVAQTGTVNQNQVLNYTGAIAGNYTVQIGDGACTQSYTFDASGCVTPCVPVTVNTSLSACAGTSVVLQGAAQTQAGTYIDSLVTPLGCDSVIITQLSFLPPIPLTQQSISICSGGSYTLNGNTYNTPGAYLDTLNSVNGCDSVILTNLQFSPTLTSLVNQNICSGSSYNFNGTLLSAEGIYTDTLSATGGCDSVIILALYINPPLTQNVNTSICEGESYTFNGTVLTESGIYVDSLSTATGCDSLVTLELAVTTCSGDFEIANILTPNGDGQNDTWKIDNPNQISGCQVKIYNRWGQPLYETSDYQNEWDGTKNNEPLPDGVYFYSIECGEKSYNGAINLLRLKK